jgi:hypothetical protein
MKKPAWEFKDGLILHGEHGTLTVHRGSGHWSHTHNAETNEIGHAVYVYEATWRSESGQTYNTFLPRNAMLRLRRLAAKAEGTA